MVSMFGYPVVRTIFKSLPTQPAGMNIISQKKEFMTCYFMLHTERKTSGAPVSGEDLATAGTIAPSMVELKQSATLQGLI